MSLTAKRVLILLGGMYHDFSGFSAWAKPVFTAAGCQVEATYDLERLTCLGAETTCWSATPRSRCTARARRATHPNG